MERISIQTVHYRGMCVCKIEKMFLQMCMQKIWTVNCIQIVVFLFLSFFLSFFIHSFSLCQSARLCSITCAGLDSPVPIQGQTLPVSTMGRAVRSTLHIFSLNVVKMYRVLRSFSYQLLQAPLFSRLLVLYIQENQKLNERIIYRMNKIII